MKKEFILILLVALFILATAAYAQMAMIPMPCGNTNNIISMLKNRHNEQMVARGPTGRGELVRIFASEKTFTVLITLTDGSTCMAASGTIWETMIRGQPT